MSSFYYIHIDAEGKMIAKHEFDSERDNPKLITVNKEVFDSINDDFYLPKWDGKQWIEGLTPEEIEAIKNPVITPDPKDERISQLEQNQLIMQETINFLLGI